MTLTLLTATLTTSVTVELMTDFNDGYFNEVDSTDGDFLDFNDAFDFCRFLSGPWIACGCWTEVDLLVG